MMFGLFGMAVLSAATLLLQVALTRVFSIAQFYHFAFLIVSLALLGFGASGSLLALFPRLRGERFNHWYAIGFASSTVLAYLFVNHVPFDSYSIAWDSTQVALLIANLLGLTLPFVFAGALIGSLLSQATERAGYVYAANLCGSAVGAMLAPLFLTWLGSERVVLLSAVFGAGAALLLIKAQSRLAVMVAAIGAVAGVGLLVFYPPIFEINPSPYKSLSQFRLIPDAEISGTYQNAYSQVDVIRSSTIHSAQGLSLTYFGDLPSQVGLLTDGGNLQPVSDASQIEDGLLQALPAAVAYTTQQQPNVLLLRSGGGLDALTALAHDAHHVTVVEPNDLIFRVLSNDLREWAGLADNPRVTLLQEEIRSFVSRTSEQFDVVELPLVDNYRPISSGAFTLTEDYSLTVEAFRSYLSVLRPNGVLVISRWLQIPPSECIRALGIILSALNVSEPLQHIVAFRSFQHVTFIVKPTAFTPAETEQLLTSIQALRYDLLLAPDMPEQMINQYERLETDIYHESFLQLIEAPDRADFYANYMFEISPPTDDKPFFFHFFRWEQTPTVIENLGRRWQPFGGSGYFVLIALLGFAVAAALMFIIIPVVLGKRLRRAFTSVGQGTTVRLLGYFTSIGLAFLLIEVSLIQRFILLLGQPTLAVAAVIGILLLFSGFGSALASRLPWRQTMFLLVALLIAYPLLMDAVTPLLLPFPVILRLAFTMLFIGPVGFLMGVPFPKGVMSLRNNNDLVPWAWAANGSASVVSAVFAATLSLSFGFTTVLWMGGGLYVLAALIRPRV
jgi:spermidine synthase